MGPKRGPNRIFDAEALRKPLGALLERSWTLLEPKKTNLEPLLGRLGALLDAYKPLYHESADLPGLLPGSPLPGPLSTCLSKGPESAFMEEPLPCMSSDFPKWSWKSLGALRGS